MGLVADSFNKAGELYAKNFIILFISLVVLQILLFLLFILVFSLILGSMYSGKSLGGMYFDMVVIYSLVITFYTLASAGLYKMALNVSYGNRVAVSDLFSQTRALPSYFFASVIYFLMLGVLLVGFSLAESIAQRISPAAFYVVSAVSLIVVIFFMIKYFFYGFVLIDRQTTAWQSLKEAAELSRGKMWSLFLIYAMAIMIFTASELIINSLNDPFLIFIIGGGWRTIVYTYILIVFVTTYRYLLTDKELKKAELLNLQRTDPEPNGPKKESGEDVWF